MMTSKFAETQQEQNHRDDLADAVKKTPKASRKQSVIDACRKIVEEHQAKRFRGVLVDAFTASAIVKVYDALNEENKAKFASYDKGDKTSIIVMSDIAFKLINKGK